MAAEAKKVTEPQPEDVEDDPKRVVDPRPATRFKKRIVGKE